MSRKATVLLLRRHAGVRARQADCGGVPHRDTANSVSRSTATPQGARVWGAARWYKHSLYQYPLAALVALVALVAAQ